MFKAYEKHVKCMFKRTRSMLKIWLDASEEQQYLGLKYQKELSCFKHVYSDRVSNKFARPIICAVFFEQWQHVTVTQIIVLCRYLHDMGSKRHRLVMMAKKVDRIQSIRF